MQNSFCDKFGGICCDTMHIVRLLIYNRNGPLISLYYGYFLVLLICTGVAQFHDLKLRNKTFMSSYSTTASSIQPWRGQIDLSISSAHSHFP